MRTEIRQVQTQVQEAPWASPGMLPELTALLAQRGDIVEVSGWLADPNCFRCSEDHVLAAWVPSLKPKIEAYYNGRGRNLLAITSPKELRELDMRLAYTLPRWVAEWYAFIEAGEHSGLSTKSAARKFCEMRSLAPVVLRPVPLGAKAHGFAAADRGAQVANVISGVVEMAPHGKPRSIEAIVEQLGEPSAPTSLLKVAPNSLESIQLSTSVGEFVVPMRLLRAGKEGTECYATWAEPEEVLGARIRQGQWIRARLEVIALGLAVAPVWRAGQIVRRR